jgi:hypothetical protein
VPLAEKPKMKTKLDGFPEVPGINIREDHRYGSSAERAQLRKDFPQYAWYLELKEATKILKLPKLPVIKSLKRLAGAYQRIRVSTNNMTTHMAHQPRKPGLGKTYQSMSGILMRRIRKIRRKKEECNTLLYIRI